MSFAQDAWQRIAPLYDAILDLPFNRERDADFYEINCRERKCNKRKQVGLTIDPDGLAAPLGAGTST
jgi:hypothetical protein